MPRGLFLSLLLLCVCSCSGQAERAAPYKSAWDRLIVRVGLDATFPPCARKEKTDLGDVLAFVGNDECFRFNPPERMRGVWLDEFEGSVFLPDATEAPPVWRYSRDQIWLDFNNREPLLGQPGLKTRAFVLDFIGRRASYPGDYGHMGVSQHLVVVDKLLSAKAVPAPQPD